MKTYKSLLFIIALIGLFSCGNSYILSPEKLEDVLVDLHLAEGMAMIQKVGFIKNNDKLDLYSTVYAKHDIDKAQFDSSMVFYSENLGDLTEVYEKVYERIAGLEADVKAGHFTPTTLVVNKEAYTRMANQDIAILPFVNREMWNKKRSYSFKNVDFTTGISDSVIIDTLANQTLEMRYSIESDSLESAQCIMTMYYDGDVTEDKTFEMSVDSSQLVIHHWEVKEGLDRITVTFDAVPMNKNASFAIEDIRLYDLSAGSHAVSLFN